MTRKLTEEETIKLVHLYREHQCLWDIRREAYKNKQMRLAALRHIRDEMAIKGLNIDEIRTKIKIIRSTYYLELNKIEKSARSGAGNVYVPRVKWFNELHSFIKTVASRRTIPIIPEDNVNNDPGITPENKVVEQHLPSSSSFTPPLRVKRKLSQRAALIRSLRNIPYERREEENDYDLFGKSVSSQLKKLSDEQAAIAQESIQSILTQCKLADIRAKKNSAFSFQNPVFSQPMPHVTPYTQSSYQPTQPIKCSPPEGSPSGNSCSFSLGFQNDNLDASSSQYNNESVDENT